MMWMHMFLTRPERTSLSWKRRSERRIVFVCRAAGMLDAWGGAMVRAPRAVSRRRRAGHRDPREALQALENWWRKRALQTLHLTTTSLHFG